MFNFPTLVKNLWGSLNLPHSKISEFQGRCGIYHALHHVIGEIGFPGGSEDKGFTCNAGDPGSILEVGRSPGEGNGNSLQYSCLENSMDRGAWWATVHSISELDTAELRTLGHSWDEVSETSLMDHLYIFWHCLSLVLEWKLTFSSPVATAEFSQICWNIECSTCTASSFRIWNSSTGIPSPPLALFIVMLPKAHLTSHSRIWL